VFLASGGGKNWNLRNLSLEQCSCVYRSLHKACDSWLWFLCDGHKASVVTASNTVVEYDDKLVRIIYFIFLHTKVIGCPRSPAGETWQRETELLA